MKEKTEFLVCATLALTSFLNNAVQDSIDSVRLTRAGCSLIYAGCKLPSRLVTHIKANLQLTQHSDGGWTDVEETAWSIAFINSVESQKEGKFKSAQIWLDAARHFNGGWGRYIRDRTRIIITSLVSALVPGMITTKDVAWLREEWARDLASSVKLSYKAGFFLIAILERSNDNLVRRTIAHLIEDQNEDGGFGPWKGHPIGSDPWSTGVVLWGLSKWIESVDKEVIEKAINWLKKTQLPNGYWSYHYLDDGTSMALIGAVAALKALAGQKRDVYDRCNF